MKEPTVTVVGEQGNEWVFPPRSYTKHARGRLALSATIWGASLMAGFTVPVFVGIWAGLPVPVMSAVTAITMGVLTYKAQVSVQTRVMVYKLARRIDAEMVGA